MNSFLEMAHPLYSEITAPMPGLSYYWSASQSAYATDGLFEPAQQLQELYPKFLGHAISTFQSPVCCASWVERFPKPRDSHGLTFKAKSTLDYNTESKES